MFRILILDSSGGPAMSCPLTSRPVYIGRAPTNDLVVGTPAVSSRHAAVWAQDRRVFVEDLGSRNGTWVDGRRVHKIRELRHGEEVLLGDAVRLRVEPVEGAPAPVVGWLIEELDGAIKLPVRTDRFRIGPHPGADLWVDDADGERTVLVDPDGAVWLGADDGSLAGVAAGEAFAVGSRRFRIVPAPVERTATVELAVVRYAYRLEVELSGPTGPRAVVSDPTTGARSAFTAPGRAVLLYLLARRVVADRAAGVPLADRGWCTDAEVASGVWGRSGETRSLNVLVTRVRNDLRRDGFDPWFLEKRHGFVRVRLDAVEVST